MNLSNYTIIEEKASVEIAKNTEGELFVIKKDRLGRIKMLQDEFNIVQYLTGLESANKRYIRRAYKMGTNTLFLEYLSCLSLKQIIDEQGYFDLKSFFEVAIQLCEAISFIHSQKVIHKDIKSSNIFYDTAKKQIYLIDFGSASFFAKQSVDAINPNLSGTLLYMSPEQTGRTNTYIDYRTDFYSLGCVFYEMLTGQTPFTNKNNADLLYSHIALQAPLLHTVNSRIPVILSQFVDKLLKKMPSERYQSTEGIKSDLISIKGLVENNEDSSSFLLAQKDFSLSLEFPNKLFGRDKEQKILTDSYKDILAGHFRLLHITGKSGSGKTTLIRQLYKDFLRNQTYYIEGKFDNLKKNIPYYAWQQCMEKYVELLLSEKQAYIEEWKKKAVDSFGSQIDVLVNLFPAFSKIFPTYKIHTVSSQENDAQVRSLFQKLLRLLSSPHYPLVLFIDDWQWADSASLDLLKVVVNTENLSYFLFINSYREDIEPNHLFRLITEKAYQKGQNISLGAIGIADIREIVSACFSPYKSDVEALTNLIFDKTAGNVFFVVRLLEDFYDDKHIFFDRKELVWLWDIDKISRLSVSVNVADLLITQFLELEEKQKKLLEIAACIGNTFEEELLLEVAKIYIENPISVLKELQLKNFLLLVGKGRSFAHDQVYEAIMLKIDSSFKKEVIFEIVSLLRHRYQEDAPQEFVFLLSQYLHQISDIIPTDWRKQSSEIFFRAAQLAQRSAAFDTAYQNFYLVEQLNVKQDLELLNALVQTSFLSSRQQESLLYKERIVNQYADPLDRVIAYETHIRMLIANEQLLDAIEQGLIILEQLGVKFPKKPAQVHALLGVLKMKLFLLNKPIEYLEKLPTIQSKHQAAIMRLMTILATPAYGSKPELFPLISFLGVKNSVKYGNSEYSSFSYATYGMIQTGILGDIELGYAFGRLAIDINKTFKAKNTQAMTLMVYNGFIRHWKEPLENTLEDLLIAYQIGQETGDFLFASFSAVYYGMHAYFIGQNLGDLYESVDSFGRTIAGMNQTLNFQMSELLRQVIINLVANIPNPTVIEGQAYQESLIIPKLITQNDQATLFDIYIYKIFLCFLFEDYQKGVSLFKECEKGIESVVGQATGSYWEFYCAMCFVEYWENFSEKEKKKFKKIILQTIQKLKKYAQYCPENHLHRYHLLLAQYNKLNKKDPQALWNYKKALKYAQKTGYLHEIAISFEKIGDFYNQHDNLFHAQLFWQQALQYYIQWGAENKVNFLLKKHPKLDTGLNATIYPEQTIKTSSTTIYNFDIETLLKVSQHLAKITNLKEFLREILSIIIEHVGAERVIFARKDEQWYVLAKGTSQNILVLDEKKSLTDENLEEKALNYVINSQKSYLSENSKQTTSILCYPILYQSKLLAIVYLDNTLNSKAFTETQIQVLDLISPQIAVSLANIDMYANLENIIEQRNREVSAQKNRLEKQATILENTNYSLIAANKKVEHINKELISSITYASRIQSAILPQDSLLKSSLSEYFILFMPRDIVSGDFYWLVNKDNLVFIAAIDCTGHGVPGAFMSMLASSLLNQIVFDKKVYQPNLILKELNQSIFVSLQQDLTKNKDGMDAVLCCIDTTQKLLYFAGAMNPLFYFKNSNEIEVLKATKLGIGGIEELDADKLYEQHTVEITQKMEFYLMSDGYQDQFGGKDDRKFMVKNVRNMLQTIHQLPMEEQRQVVEQTILDWKGNKQQTDDILMIGFRVGE